MSMGTIDGVRQEHASAVVIHRGPIPGTDVGTSWFESNGHRFAISGWPHGINKGWAYEIGDRYGRMVDDNFFTLDEIRDWAAWRPDGLPPLGTREKCAACGATVWLRFVGTQGYRSERHPEAPIFEWRRVRNSLWFKECPTQEGRIYEFRNHQPDGYEATYFGPTLEEMVGR